MDYYVTINERNHQAYSQLVELQDGGVSIDFIIDPDGTDSDYHMIVSGVTKLAIEKISKNRNIALLAKHLCTDEIAQECSTEFYKLPKENSKFKFYTDSCVVITHEPTGISAKSEVHRSKWHNKTEALNIIMSKLVAKNA